MTTPNFERLSPPECIAARTSRRRKSFVEGLDVTTLKGRAGQILSGESQENAPDHRPLNRSKPRVVSPIGWPLETDIQLFEQHTRNSTYNIVLIG